MPLTRTFIDWKKPILSSVVEDLQKTHTVLGNCDLSNVLMVFPGGQAGRRFLEILTRRTEGRCTPPRTITVGQLPEFLYEPKRPFASDLTQQLAWGEALRRIPRQRLSHVLKSPPDQDNIDAWLSLGELLSRQHRELAADLLDFGDVARRGKDIPGFTEQDRWNVLKEVQTEYLAILDRQELWDLQTARLVAIDLKECHTDQEIVLVGTGDINGTLREMLRQVAGQVTTCIHAPRSLEHLFDEFGCLKPEAWSKQSVDLQTEQIIVVDRMTDQADAVARTIASYSGRWPADEITVGVPDERVVPFIQRTLEQCGVPARWVVDRQVGESEPWLLLQAIAEFLENDEVSQLASLLRHPDLSDWLLHQGLPDDWLTCFDSYLNEHLPRKLDQFLGDGRESGVVKRIKLRLDDLLKPLRGEARLLTDWGAAIIDLLLEVYRHVRFQKDSPEDRVVLEACREIQQAVRSHADIPAELMPQVSSPQAIRLTLGLVSALVIPPPDPGPAVQISGWLELPQDDAAALILTGFNEGRVPSSVNHDLFLPDSLRRSLGLEDNARRYARDCYTLQVLLHSRQHVTVIVGQRDQDDEPLSPSRLLFAADEPTIAQRVLKCFRKVPETNGPPLPGTLATDLSKSTFTIPKPPQGEFAKDSFRVTEFRDYLASPYRYYLRHILQLASLSDEGYELHAGSFGTLIHEVLSEFGRSVLIRATDSLEIRHFLDASLERLVTRIYGKSPLYPVILQVEQARLRLHDFADWQADWVRQGWEVRFVEVSSREPVLFPIDGKQTIQLKGRIDRIDYHTRRKEWMIIDYKTGDQISDPRKAHQQGGEWVDLQLPLYRHLARPLGVQGSVQLAYVKLPREGAAVEESVADWSEEELLEADSIVPLVVQKIWRGEFWEEMPSPSGSMSEYDAICQTMVAENEVYL